MDAFVQITTGWLNLGVLYETSGLFLIGKLLKKKKIFVQFNFSNPELITHINLLESCLLPKLEDAFELPIPIKLTAKQQSSTSAHHHHCPFSS